MRHDFFLILTLVNSNRPQDKRFPGTRLFLGHIDRVPQGLTVPGKDIPDNKKFHLQISILKHLLQVFTRPF